MATSLESLALQRRAVEALERIANALQPQPTPTAAAGSCPNCGAPEDKQVEAGNLTTGAVTKCLVCQMEYSAA